MNIQLGITDHFDPEVQAMLQAMYSRSAAPISSRLPADDESVLQHKEKLGKFYVGYNHKSVGQLASTTIWFEGVSQLAAKAIENTPLFNGQECSSRYIDFSNQPMANLEGYGQISIWQERWRTFYLKALPITLADIKSKYPLEKQPEGTKESVWENTCKARAFDICRGFLPAGITTNVSFTGTFDLINDHFGEMLYHPSKEMRDIAKSTLEKLSEKYSYAAIPTEKLLERNEYLKRGNEYFYSSENLSIRTTFGSISSIKFFNPLSSYNYPHVRNSARNKFEKLPLATSSRYRHTYSDIIDFGSFRDLHRHRNGVMPMPLLNTNLGFNSFYLENLPNELSSEFQILLKEFGQFALNNSSIVDFQYCVPMGYNVYFEYTCDLNQALYILELRSGKTVHQSLRTVIHRWAKLLQADIPDLKFYVDFDADNFTLKRGTQTFSEKASKPHP